MFEDLENDDYDGDDDEGQMGSIEITSEGLQHSL